MKPPFKIEETIPYGLPLGGRWISFRAALVHDDGAIRVGSDPLEADVSFSDGSAVTNVVPSEEVGAVPGLYPYYYDNGGSAVERWGSVRIPVACALDGIDPADLRSVRIELNDRMPGFVAIDDLVLE